MPGQECTPGHCVYGVLILSWQGCHIIFMGFWVLWFSKTCMCARIWGKARVHVLPGNCLRRSPCLFSPRVPSPTEYANTHLSYTSSLTSVHAGKSSSVTRLCLTLCDPIDHSVPGLSVHHQLPEFTQTPVHGVGDAIQPSHPLWSPSPPAFSPSQHQGLFQ